MLLHFQLHVVYVGLTVSLIAYPVYASIGLHERDLAADTWLEKC